MAPGYDRYYGRKAQLQALGRALSRRAGARCELCGAGGHLEAVEVEPVGDEPSLDRALLACDRCRAALDDDRTGYDPREMRFLGEVAWSEVPPLQLAAVRLLRRFAEHGEDWAAEVLEGLYLDPEVEALV